MGFAYEDQLLILCARVRMSDEIRARAVALLGKDLDWDYLLETSIRHGVSPLMYHGLNQVGARGRIPAYIEAELHSLYQNTRRRNRRLYGVLGEICRACEVAGISVLGLKEIHLARDVYPDIGLRPIGDLDILIRHEEYGRVAACLDELGFTPLPGRSLPFTLKYALAHHFHRQVDNVWVDLQWGILQRQWDVYGEGAGTFDIAGIWQGAIRVAIDDFHLLAPRPEDMLFHLCLHLEGHDYSELCLFCDIVELLRQYQERLDWRYFMEVTTRYDAGTSVYYVLFLVHRLLHAVLPSHLLEDLAPTYIKANLFEPMFGNLTRLHLMLDDVRLAVSPPRGVLRAWEAEVRLQTASAMHYYKAVDRLVSAFLDAGGELAILNGAPAEKELPDAALRPFGCIQWLIRDQDLGRARNVLVEAGFTPAKAPSSERYFRRWDAQSVDPALAIRPISLTLQVEIEPDPDALLRHIEGGAVSMKDAAIKVTKARLLGHVCDSRMVLPVRIVALKPEMLVLLLSVRLGRATRDHLFRMCSLLDYFRATQEPPDWQQVAWDAERLGVRQWACAGIQMVSDILDTTQVPQQALSMLGCSGPPPRLLQSARYDPASWGRYSGFKRAFYVLFTLLTVAGLKGKCGYLYLVLAGDPHARPVAPRVMQELATSTLSLLRPRHRTVRDYAFWTAPERPEGSPVGIKNRR